MRIADSFLADLRIRGYCVVPEFLGEEELHAAQAAMAEEFPSPDDYFANPDDPAHARFAKSQFAGLKLFPYRSWALNRLAFHPDLVDGIERFLGSPDLQVYKIELWAKYSGAINYDQPMHRDFGNHSLVVPRADGWGMQVTSFILLSDVTVHDGPTMVVPLQHTRELELVPDNAPRGWEFGYDPARFADVEVPVTGPAGSLFMYRTDVLHRASDFNAPGRSRFALLVDYQVRGPAWAGKMAWPNHAQAPGFVETMERATPRERELFGFPAVGDPYWNAQTVRDVGRRYPRMDMHPYQ
jgi:hypothetical protein